MEEEEEAAESITNTNTESNLKLFVLINSAWLRSDSVRVKLDRLLCAFQASLRAQGSRSAVQVALPWCQSAWSSGGSDS